MALVEGGEMLAEINLSQTGRRHARTLVAELKRLFNDVGREPSHADVVAVSIGPGSFTGLRVGVVCAKTFAYATGAKAVAVDTLLSIAENTPADVNAVDVVVDAQRGEVFHARYRRGSDANFRRESETVIVDAMAFLESRDASAPITGPGLARYQDHPSHSDFLSIEKWQPRASVVARIGERLADEGQTDDFWSLEPLYIRRSAAEEKADAQRR